MRGAPFTGKLSAEGRENWQKAEIPPGFIVLEMKYREEPPFWMTVVARIAEVERSAYAKYGQCIEATRPELMGLIPVKKLAEAQVMRQLMTGEVDFGRR